MECLGIPIDHRLRRLIREVRPIHTNVGDSDHIRILQEFRTSLKVKGSDSDYLTAFDLNFGIEMARPETKGGVVVVLLQPHSSQDNSDGFLAGKENWLTIRAISELISAASNARFGFDDISEATEAIEENLLKEAHHMFATMVEAKQPEVVISCFKTKSSNMIVKNLCSRRIGYCFDFDPQGSRQLAELGLNLTRVNAFHPSYAINYNPEFSCFKRLLLLEFVKAFALWQGNWISDEGWMAHWRDECRKQAIKLLLKKKLFLVEDIHIRWKTHYYKGQWEEPLQALEVSFNECVFGDNGLSLAGNAENHSYRLVESKITWKCFDIAWILEMEKILAPDIDQQLLLQFKSFDGCDGFYDYSTLLLMNSKQHTPHAKKLESIFFTFLRDLNLSYTLSGAKYLTRERLREMCFEGLLRLLKTCWREPMRRKNQGGMIYPMN
ncbi:uncharacterized protein N7483_002661 [Penicillium malachiteum]|uniref:uncharacterized protein n=1 Tax=Penicillium malachiteum TaxID=1324776 RepID=UPI0025497830|nr:uncharacterized protein N7483_002661 [Penicillium malachiteum]KAJ5737536.1 hypothetical protein N7483_002661 [Penicillium malachiteum]